MRTSLARLAPAIALLALAALSHADEALTFTGGTVFSGGPYSVGWSFTTDAPLTVGSLGWFDVGQWTTSDVGIYDATATLLTSTTVTKASDALASSGFRYHALSSALVLPAGTYRIAGVGTQFYCENGSGPSPITVSTLPNVTYGSAWFSPSNALIYPANIGDRGKGYFGPSFQTEAVPEPASLAALGFGALGLLRRRKAVRA